MSNQPDLYAAIEELTAVDGPFETVERNVNGVICKVFKQQPESLRDLFALVPTHGDKDFLVYQTDRLTYSQTWQAAGAFAHALQEDLAVLNGDRVAIVMRNLPEWIITYIAVTSIGAIVVPMNSWWTKNELAYGLQDSGARVVVADPQRLQQVREAGHTEITCVLVREQPNASDILSFSDLLARHKGKDMPVVSIDSDADASIMYTSGSTGNPKGAVATHRAILSAIMSWAMLGMAALKERCTDTDAEEATAALLAVPLFHVTGCNTMFLLSVLTGRKIVMMHKWRAEDALELIEKEKITYFNGVPTMSRELQLAAETSGRDTSSLREVFAGGAARPPQHVQELEQAFPAANFGVGYGLTETCGIGTANSSFRYSERPASAGKVIPPITELKIINEAGDELPANQPGEICIKGAVNMRCYWNKPEATAAAIENGWFRSGDVGYLDEEDYLFIVDRLNDIIIRGGENISCVEVEAALYEHAAVAEVAVFGVPDERLGEVVFAVVTARDNKEIASEQLKTFVAERIAAFKVPAHISVIHETLPRTGTGKIFKRQIRDVVVQNFNN